MLGAEPVLLVLLVVMVVVLALSFSELEQLAAGLTEIKTKFIQCTCCQSVTGDYEQCSPIVYIIVYLPHTVTGFQAGLPWGNSRPTSGCIFHSTFSLTQAGVCPQLRLSIAQTLGVDPVPTPVSPRLAGPPTNKTVFGHPKLRFRCRR